jgi:hypothetical protein
MRYDDMLQTVKEIKERNQQRSVSSQNRQKLESAPKKSERMILDDFVE